MNDSLLRINDLHTYFYTHDGIVKAVDGLDLNVGHGETIGLVGESGCGKSVTALSILRLIQNPPGKIIKGKILFEGKDLLQLTPNQMRKIRGNQISMIFQEPMTSLNPVFTIGSQVVETIRLHMNVSKKEAYNRALEMLKKVAISDRKKRINEFPHQMSGGMRQRIMIASALSCNPKILIADEPTTALDVTIQAQILDLMNTLKEDVGASVILITHDLGVIAEMAQSVAVMYTGKIVEFANAVELFTNPLHPYTLGLMASLPRLNGAVTEDRLLSTISGVVPSLIDLPKGCNFWERCSQTMDICQNKDPELIDVGSGHMLRCWLYEK
jgi:oligopeptide/dipeptide ABC transporter ATP-binding protein